MFPNKNIHTTEPSDIYFRKLFANFDNPLTLTYFVRALLQIEEAIQRQLILGVVQPGEQTKVGFL